MDHDAPPEPVRIARVLADLGVLDRVNREQLDAVAQQVTLVTSVADPVVPTWRVGAQMVRRVPHARGALDGFSCSCGGRRCAHELAVLFVRALADPQVARRFTAPDWEVALGDLSDPPALRSPPPGHVRYEIDPPSPGRAALGLRPVVVRPTGQTERAPRTLAALRQAVPATEADLDILPAWVALERAVQLERGKEGPASRQLSRALLEPLSRARHVTLDGSPVRVSTTPVRPHVAAERTPEGLTLAWDPPIRLRWDHAGLVLTEDGVLHPLAADVHPELALRVGDPLPTVPASDIERFVDRIVVDRGLPVALPDGVGLLRDPDAKEARLVLAEDGPTLVVRLDLVYRRGEAEAAVQGPAEPTLDVPGQGRVRRDLDWEHVSLHRAREALGALPPLRLQGQAALDFLTTRVPELGVRWPVYGEDGLVHHRVVGTASPSVSFRSGEDWFDLEARFEVTTSGGKPKRVPLAPVLASWLAGGRYVRLDDGTLAALPTRWLQRHAKALDLLAETRRVQRRLSSWHVWQAGELLREAEGEGMARWLTQVDALATLPARPPGRPPEGLRATLRSYQQRGLDWLRFLRDHDLHGILADDMGLGKTLQALAVILDSRSPRPSLVVTTTSVLHGWLEQAARFTPDLRVIAHHGSRRGDLDADLIVTTYGTLRRDIGLLGAHRFHYVVLDEGQLIKNPASTVARCAFKLSSDHRLVLTGTPLENHLTDLWSLFRFLQPSLLGTRRAFHARYAGPATRVPDAPAVAELADRIRPFLLRRMKADVAPELPPRTEVTLKVTLSPPERRLYDSLLETVRHAVEEEATQGRRNPSLHVLAALTRLRQACCDASLLPFPEARQVRTSAKLDLLDETLAEALAGGHRCLVFSHWPSLLRRAAARCDERGVSWLMLDGTTTDRRGVVAAFQAPDGPPVFFISTRAGGAGLNLTAADTVIHVDPWWNPAVEDQATDRAHRLGQDRPVTVIRLVAEHTVEEKVVRLQERKRTMIEGALQPGGLDTEALGTLLDDREDP